MDGEEYAEDSDMDEVEDAAEGEEELAVDDQAILSMLKAERLNSVGFEGDDDLSEQRQTALDYTKGVMDDLKPMKNRSKAMSSDVGDAIETVIPDLMEILAGGEDVGSFRPDGPEDEEPAKQETDYVNEVIFEQNAGFLTLYSAIQDALKVKTGLIKSWWQDYEYDEEEYTGKNAAELEMAKQDAEITSVMQEPEPGAMGEPLFTFTAKKIASNGCEKIESVDPANFGVSKDTVKLCDTPYCIERSEPRAFQLVDEGYDPEVVSQLRQFKIDTEEDRARDTVEESDATEIVNEDMRRTVVVHTHTIRADFDGDGKSELWEIVTDSDETLILGKKRKNRVGYAAGTPFINAHRFYGSSLADKLIEVQRIKTVLLRMMLDNGYFSLNQRYEVAEQKMSLNTISDLLRNEPGYPVRSKTGDAVRPLSNATLQFDVTGALEYMSTVAEGRSGVVRNAQGLNPDTLHDTKGGMEKLFSAAQRRVRMIARIFAETLVKDLFLNVHGDIRDHATHTQQVRLNGKWTPVNPTSWGSRNDMTIELGVGSGGKEAEILAMREIIGMQMKAVEGQAAGMIKKPLVTEKELYASSKRLSERLGFKNPEAFFADPDAPVEPELGPDGQPVQEPPSPEEMQAEAEMQQQQAEFAAKQEAAKAEMDLRREIAVEDARLEREKAQAKLDAMREEAQLKNQLARDSAAAELDLARERMRNEMILAREKQDMDADLARTSAAADAHIKANRPGGDLSV